MSEDTFHNQPAPSKKASEYYFTAPVEIPTREQMKVKLVPVHLVNRLEEARSDEHFWGAVFWAVMGAILGIICNWATSDPIKITRPSLVVMALFAAIGLLTFVGGVRKYQDRAKGIQLEVIQAGVTLPDREFATLRKQAESAVLTILSGKVGEFSHVRDGPWMPPVACKPLHSRWRAIEEATWVWIKERPTNQEAQRGQVVWHRFDFQLNRPSTWVSKATLSLMVDDYANIAINGEPLRRISIDEEVVELDVAAYLQSGKNVIEMEIENEAFPQSTGLGNPTGVIYRLDIR